MKALPTNISVEYAPFSKFLRKDYCIYSLVGTRHSKIWYAIHISEMLLQCSVPKFNRECEIMCSWTRRKCDRRSNFNENFISVFCWWNIGAVERIWKLRWWGWLTLFVVWPFWVPSSSDCWTEHRSVVSLTTLIAIIYWFF